MKYLLLISLIFLSSCTYSKEDCEFGNGVRKFWMRPVVDCSNEDYTSHSDKNKEWMEVNKKGCEFKIPGKFKVIDKKSGYYNCQGTIEHYPFLNNNLIWQYYFATFRCGKEHPDFGFFFTHNQLKRIGNLAD
jgi:hypothetical protein